MKEYDVAVIGGGAAGLACAVRLKELNKVLTVTVVEGGVRAGRKIAATGNGQGNYSNADMSARHFHGSFASLAARLCADPRYFPETLFDFVTVTDGSGRKYPAGRQASAISDCLIKKATQSGADIRLNSPVSNIERGFIITLPNEKIFAKRVLFATGGSAQKQFLTDGSAFALVDRLGHTQTPLYPSLIQLRCVGGFKALRGIRAECIVKVLSHDGKELARTCGDVIFTDYGLSGNAIFYASAYCAGLKGVRLCISFLPDVPEERIASAVEERISHGYPVQELLGGTLHNALGREIIKRCKGGNAREIAHLVKNFTVEVQGSLGWDYAQVTRGGIPQSEVTDRLESKIIRGLYFAGETLDLDGDCGGYNLHFAFASGMYAAENIAADLGAKDD